MRLNHTMSIYNVVRSSIAANEDKESDLGSFKLEQAIAELSDDEVKQLFERIRDWNTNRRFFVIAQRLIKVLLLRFSAEKLSGIPGMMNIIGAIIPYSERHYSRYDDLVERSYTLDYVANKMDELAN